jgi:hypothetical protein
LRLHALIGATLLALAASATFPSRPAAEPETPARKGLPTAVEIAAFQAQAEQACRCARARPDESGKKDCWAGFERAIAPWPHDDEATMCEFSLEGICFGDGFNACVTKSWSGPVGGNGTMCTPEELQTAEAVFMEALLREERGESRDSAYKALERTLAAFARNDKFAARRSEGGCGGG